MEYKSNCIIYIKNCLILFLVKFNYNIYKIYRKVGIEEDSYISF